MAGLLLRLGVKGGDVRGQRPQQGRRQPAGGGDVVEQRALLEALHDDDPVDRLAGLVTRRAAPGERAVGPAADRPDFQIELRRGATIEAQFGGAGRATPRDGREVEIGVFDRALQLVGAAAGEKDQRDVRLDGLHGAGAGRVGSGIAQKRDNLALGIVHR